MVSKERYFSESQIIKLIDNNTRDSDSGLVLTDDITCILERATESNVTKIENSKWIPHISSRSGLQFGYDCGRCKSWYIMPEGLFKFCPECGASMRRNKKSRSHNRRRRRNKK